MVEMTSAGSDGLAEACSWPELLSLLLAGEDLSAEASAWAMDRIMSGEASDAQIAGFATALRAKGETVAEVSGLVEAMYRHASTIDVPGPTLDLVGTGGDRARTVNISTMASIVAAGAGVRVVKHGNRAASSASGASDILEKLGVNLGLPTQRVAEVAEEAGITYCPAPLFHPALRHAAAARRELGVPTIFNFLGPLVNPARVRAQATGVADRRIAPVLAGVLAARGVSALVFRGEDGLDELTVTTTSEVWVVRHGAVERVRFDPRDVGVPLAELDALRGGDAEYNADVARRVLGGERGPVRDAVLLNAAAGLAAAEPGELSLTETVAAGMERAARSVDSGAAHIALQRWSAATRAPR